MLFAIRDELSLSLWSLFGGVSISSINALNVVRLPDCVLLQANIGLLDMSLSSRSLLMVIAPVDLSATVLMDDKSSLSPVAVERMFESSKLVENVSLKG